MTDEAALVLAKAVDRLAAAIEVSNTMPQASGGAGMRVLVLRDDEMRKHYGGGCSGGAGGGWRERASAD